MMNAAITTTVIVPTITQQRIFTQRSDTEKATAMKNPITKA